MFLSLFYFFGGDGTDRAGLGGGYIPRRCPLHSSAPGTTAQGDQDGGGALEGWQLLYHAHCDSSITGMVY